jgi:ABC-type multidrug transport system ATPase subunit
MSVLQADSIRKSWKEKRVLSDIFLSCATGEVIGVLGRNGSGKSTLFRIIYGEISSESRFVKVDQTILNTVGSTRYHINYLPQQSFLPMKLKVGSALELFITASVKGSLEEDAILKPLLQKNIYELSFGERRFVEVILLLHGKAAFILLDEPFKGLGPLIRDEIIRHIENVRDRKGIILSDHSAEEVLRISDKILFLKNGFLREIEQKEQLIELGYLPRDFEI